MSPDELKRLASYWKAEIVAYDKESEKWRARGKKVVDRYMDERVDAENVASRFNILWSNIETIMPAVYARAPKPSVSRRHNDRSPVGRVASMVLERCLDYETSYYRDFDSAIRLAVKDRLLPGRGIAWVRYQPTFGEAIQITDDSQMAEETAEESDEIEATEYLEHECSPVDYVHWEHFGHTCARTWEEVTGVWRDVALTRKELEERFGDTEEVRNIPMDVRDDGEIVTKERPGNKAKIYEIWDKANKRAIWLHMNMDEPLEVLDDPLQLQGFWPCPSPIYATTSSDSLIPVPDYCMYQDQARELDDVTARIALLTDAIKVAGVYNAAIPELKQLLSSERNNKLVPVDSWSVFAESGGLKGSVDFLPLGEVLNALIALHESRDKLKDVIYEITGLSDIIRGASDSRETATAQRIKSQFGSLRIRTVQEHIAKFAQELLCIKAEIIANHYSDETIYNMAGVSQLAEQDQMIFPAALELIRNDLQRGFLIEIQTDSMVQMDEQAEQAARVEFLGAAGAFLEKAVQIGQIMPEMGPLLGEMLMFGIRGFRVGRSIEGVFDETVERMKSAPPRPNPEAGKQQAAQADMQAKQQYDQFKAQLDMQKQQMQLQKDQMEMQMEARLKQMEAALEVQGMEVEARQLQNRNQFEQAQHVRKMESMEQKQRGGNGSE